MSVSNSCLNGVDAAGTVGVWSDTDGGPLTVTASNNEVSNWDVGFATYGPALLTAGYNSITSNVSAGYDNSLGGAAQNAENNWWGAADGPSGTGPGSGDAIVGALVDFDPWLHSSNDTNAGCGFSTVSFDIVATAGPNGSIAPPGTTSVNQGGDLTYTITPDACYQVADVLVEEPRSDRSTSYTFTDVHGESHDRRELPSSVLHDHGDGGLRVARSRRVARCRPPAVGIRRSARRTTVLHDRRREGRRRLGRCGEQLHVHQRAGQPHHRREVHTDAPSTITATAGAGGTIRRAARWSVPCGGDQTFTIAPAACYSIADVKVDGVSAVR